MRLPIGEGDVVCLDWDERTLRLVAAGPSRGGVKIRSAVCVPMTVAPDDAAALGELVRRTLAEHRLRARRAFVNVPRQDALLNLLSLPTGTRDELAAMVHIQIAKDLPFAKDQTVIDFAVTPQVDNPANVDVWVAAVRNSVIDFYRQVVMAAGLRLERLGLRPYANLAALNAAVEATGRTLLVDVGPSMTEIDLLRDGRLAYSRSATVGLPEDGQLSYGSAVMDNLLVEVNRTIAAYRSTDAGARIDRIVLAGTAKLDASVARAFQERFGTPAAVFSVPAGMKWRAGHETAAPYSAAIGLALSITAENLNYFNLLAPKEPEGERRERIRKVPYRAAVVIGLLAAGAVAAYVPFYRVGSDIARIQREINTLNQDKKERDELSTFLGQVDGWRSKSACWIDHLNRITSVLPSTKEGYIIKADFTEKGEIKLEILAKNEFVAGKIVRAVQELEHNGKPLYSAKPVGAPTKSQDPAYQLIDKVNIQVLSMLPPVQKRR